MPTDKNRLLDEQHWVFEDYRQRVRANEWKDLLLQSDDKIIFKGRMRQLAVKELGFGVYEVYKEPEKAKTIGGDDYERM